MTAPTVTVTRPPEIEYSGYFAGYVNRVGENDVFTMLAGQSAVLNNLLAALTAEQADFRPAPAEWSIKEVIGHVNDTERVFSYRALRISRNDQTPLAGFEQDDFVRESNFDDRTLPDLLEEFDLLRRANLLNFSRLSPQAVQYIGVTNGKATSVRALLYMMAGHVDHHIESLKVDYLPKMPK
jgi:hypothetical protein